MFDILTEWSCVLRQGPTPSLPARELLVRTQFFETLAAGISSSWFIACSDSRKKRRVQPCLNSHISTTFNDHHFICVQSHVQSCKGMNLIHTPWSPWYNNMLHTTCIKARPLRRGPMAYTTNLVASPSFVNPTGKRGPLRSLPTVRTSAADWTSWADTRRCNHFF